MPVKIFVDDVYSRVVEPNQHLATISCIRDVCKARPNGYKYMKRYKSGQWDGYISLMNGYASFPSGLLDLVLAKLEKENIKYELIRPDVLIDHEPVTANTLADITLRDYQIDAANALLYTTRGVAKMATNSGKTEVFAAMIKVLNCKSVVLVHRKELMYQTADRIETRLGGDTTNRQYTGRVGDGLYETNKQITVCMIQTLHNRLQEGSDIGWLADTKAIFADEVHHISSNQMLDCISSIPGHYRYGFSGTPMKRTQLEDLKLIGYTGPVIVDISNVFLVEAGWSAEPIVNIATVEDYDESLYDKEYAEAYNELIVHNERRNAIIRDFVHKHADKTILILVDRIDHGLILTEMIDGASFVSGSDSTEVRSDAIASMRNGNGGVYIASPIFDEGVDVPSVDVVVIAAAGKSNIKLLQRIGRGMRRKVGKDNVLTILDFIDDTNKHLLKHSEQRMATYEQEGFTCKFV